MTIILREYEMVLGQMMNLDKSVFYLHEKAYVAVCHRIRRMTREVSFYVLGMPYFLWETKAKLF